MVSSFESLLIASLSFLLLSLGSIGVDACGCEASLPQDPFDPLGPWHQRHLDCGIPPFAYRLPQDAQAKIHAIWIKYEAGDDCDAEQEQTRDVIMGIPEEVRFQLFKGVCGPGFLKNESTEVKQDFQKIWFDEKLSVEQKQDAFKKLASARLTGEALKRFEKFDQILEGHIKERQEVLSKLSPPAKDAYNKWNGMRKEERTFLSGLSPEIRMELGLICKCCGSCKTGQKTAPKKTTRAARAVAVENLMESMAKADAQMLVKAAAPECY